MTTDYSFVITPLLAWLLAGCSKFVINSLRARRLAFDLIGYGGMPSNHSAIVSSMAMLIALKEGVAHPAFGVAVTLAFIVMLDASSLRRQVGLHAQAINALSSPAGNGGLRERMGHTRSEIAAGLFVGVCTGWLVWAAAPAATLLVATFLS
ncbi:MAG: divergent PAP2 family protein [Moraxellaceae bacterium]|nr:divergent PAP2 family protein [Moraxellaceae bacterium]